MEKTIQILSREQPIEFYRATVIHANKFYRTQGGMFNLPVTSTLYTDVVFRDKASGDDWPITIVNLDLPLYNDQEVNVICVNNIIIGFVDIQTSRYYYTVYDFSKGMKLGMPYWWVWVIGVVGGAITYLAYDQYASGGWMVVPLVAAMLYYYIQKWVINYRVNKSLDNYMSD